MYGEYVKYNDKKPPTILMLFVIYSYRDHFPYILPCPITKKRGRFKTFYAGIKYSNLPINHFYRL